MEDIATFDLTFAEQFVGILANFAKAVANFATGLSDIFHCRYLRFTEISHRKAETRFVLVDFDCFQLVWSHSCIAPKLVFSSELREDIGAINSLLLVYIDFQMCGLSST